ALHGRSPIAPGEPVPRGKFLDATEPGARRRRVMPGVVNSLRIRLGRDKTARENRLDLAGEQQRRFRLGPVERLDAEPISRREQRPARTIPDGEGEHSIESIEAPRAPLLVSREYDLGVSG